MPWLVAEHPRLPTTRFPSGLGVHSRRLAMGLCGIALARILYRRDVDSPAADHAAAGRLLVSITAVPAHSFLLASTIDLPVRAMGQTPQALGRPRAR